MDLSRRTWNGAIRLAFVISSIAALVAIGVSTFGDVPNIVVVLPVIVVAFTASWVRTGRLRHDAPPLREHRGAVPIG